ncbi:MAG: Type 1 glutamine amidotransferase-like domain-containing protein [Anaerolineae bacterium]
MRGTLALVGAGEFLDTMNEVDRQLLASAGGKRVVVLPTASAPDGPGVPERWARMGVEHFTNLGAQVEGVMALDRAGCESPEHADRVRAANLVYFSGGKPDYLYQTLAGSAVWSAVQEVLARGGMLAGCSAGAMIMGAYVPEFNSRFGVPSVNRWQEAFALVPHAIVAPHYNEFPEMMVNLIFGHRPADTYLIGVDGHTALVGQGEQWQAVGAGRVTVRHGPATHRYTAGQAVALV